MGLSLQILTVDQGFVGSTLLANCPSTALALMLPDEQLELLATDFAVIAFAASRGQLKLLEGLVVLLGHDIIKPGREVSTVYIWGAAYKFQ